MDRSGTTRAADALVTLLVAVLAASVVAALWLVPPVALDRTDLAWLPSLLAGALAVTATLAAAFALVGGLRHASPQELISAGASAALAGGAVALLTAGASLATPTLSAAALLGASMVAGWARLSARRAQREVAVGIAGAVLLVAEASVLIEILPASAAVVAGLRVPILAAAITFATLTTVGRGGGVGAAVAVGAAGLLADRGGTLESVAGLAALVGSQLFAIRFRREPAAMAPDTVDAKLPELASRLTDPVLRFDGRLELRDWNGAAAGLLGLEAASTGTRLEDLLGVSIAELPGDESTIVTRRVLGGLEVAIHRSGPGMTAVIRDPGATPEGERLGHELRATIEELLRARRTIDLQRGELERSSTVDPLTGVASRGAILERLRLEVAQARRYHHPLAVVLLDIDGFGEINRVHGIAGGDAVLREVALRIRLRVREADELGRNGSDGFIAALPHTDHAGAATFADALRHRLAQRPIAVGDALVSVTVSIGVATMGAGEDLDLDGLLARVEEALASARSAGGDRIALDRQHGLVRLEDPHGAQDPGRASDGATAVD